MKKLGKTAKLRAARAMKHLPRGLQHVVLSKGSPPRRIAGTFGPASGVRHIDPATVREKAP